MEDTKHKKQEEDIKNGFVACDSFCKAKELPKSLKEYEETLRHYKYHSYLRGCSHGT